MPDRYLYYVAFVDVAGDLRMCQIRSAVKLEGLQKKEEISKALTARFGTIRQFVSGFDIVEPAVSILLEGGSVKSVYSTQDNLKAEVFDLDLRSDGTTELEQKIRATKAAHMVEVEVVSHYDKNHA